jgi:hypothetical protein
LGLTLVELPAADDKEQIRYNWFHLILPVLTLEIFACGDETSCEPGIGPAYGP